MCEPCRCTWGLWEFGHDGDARAVTATVGTRERARVDPRCLLTVPPTVSRRPGAAGPIMRPAPDRPNPVPIAGRRTSATGLGTSSLRRYIRQYSAQKLCALRHVTR